MSYFYKFFSNISSLELKYSPIFGGICGTPYGLYKGSIEAMRDNDRYKHKGIHRGVNIVDKTITGGVTYGVCGTIYFVIIPCYMYYKLHLGCKTIFGYNR